MYEHTINLEVKLKLGDKLSTSKVKGQSQGLDRTIVGLYDNNSIINSIKYELEFPYIKVKKYALNVNDDNILYQVDSEG